MLDSKSFGKPEVCTLGSWRVSALVGEVARRLLTWTELDLLGHLDAIASHVQQPDLDGKLRQNLYGSAQECCVLLVPLT